MNTETLIKQLNHPQARRRIEAIAELGSALRAGKIPQPKAGQDVNNHIHTIYSFSPYSPTGAVWRSFGAGLRTAGIMDHDTLSGAEEFIEAGKTVGLATTIGVECRCDFTSTPLADRRFNNPDQLSNAYVAIHGIPHTHIQTVCDYFQPLREARNRRNRRMVRRLNDLIVDGELLLDFDSDVTPLSMHHEGGSITERHILFALSKRMIRRFEKGGSS